MAKAFIRRLSQPEAVGWFGLANVYASFAAAATAAGLALLLLLRGTDILPVSWSRSPFPSSTSSKSKSSSLPPFAFVPTLLLSLFTLLSATALSLAHSKGGYLAFIAVLHSIAFLFFFASRPPSPNSRRLATLLGIAAILGPIALVLLRGLIGERAGLHELSLLFRSFYTHASARIFLDNPVVGVGPDGYQSAFLLAKPPLCPEEVMSPHCIVQDWLADLGILGAAWLCILFRFAIQATTNAISTPIRAISTPISATATSLSAITTPSLKFEISNLKLPPPPPPSRPDLRLLLLLPALATILAAYIESPFITIDLALVRVLGLAAWCATGFAIARLISDSPASRIALAAAALALIAHAQIDVTASFVPSAPLWLMLISLAAAPYTVPPRTALGPRCSPSHALQALAILPPLLLSSLLLYTSLSHVLPWERRLTNAAATVRPLAEFSERLAALSHIEHAAQPADSLDRIVRDLALAVGHPVQPNEVSFNTAMRELESQFLPKAAATLETAQAILPDDWRPLREASRLHLQLAESARRVPHDTSPTPLIPSDELARLSIAPGHAHFVRAESILQLGPTAASRPHLPAEWHWLATILERRADLFSESDSLARATDARHHVAALDPYNLDNALRIFRDYQKLHDQPNAQRSAARTLELHNFTRLDRETRGLSPQDLADVQSAAQAP